MATISPHDARGDVQPATLAAPARHGHVERTGLEAAFQRLRLFLFEGLFVFFCQRFLDAIGFDAVRGPFFLGHFADLLQRLQHFALLAEIFAVPGAQGGLVGAGFEFGAGTLFEDERSDMEITCPANAA